MNVEEQVRDDLRAAPAPAGLVAPPGLADTVLHRLRRRRRLTMAAAAAAVVTAAAVVVPLAASGRSGGSDPGPGDPGIGAPVACEVAGEPPTGGPQTVHAYASEAVSHLLDPRTGRYHEFPFLVVVSPDLRTVAVAAGDRIGLAERRGLLDQGASAVDWTDLPVGNGLSWSPDGTALLSTSIDKSGGGPMPAFIAHRYDLASGEITDTPIEVNLLGSSVGWASDSRRYIALVRGEPTNDTVEPGGLRAIDPDGTVSPLLEGGGGLVGGAESYSPSRTYLVADATQIMSARPLGSTVVDAATGGVVATLPSGARPVGWYDETTVARLAVCDDRPVVELVDIATGTVGRAVWLGPKDWVTFETRVQLGSSAGLPDGGAGLAF
jgi:hypothetical protein